ncbi:MAG: ABC transporter permease [Planctomycetota bacterium]
MSLFTYVLRGLKQRPLSSALTALSVALGVMLVTSILAVQHEVERSYGRQSAGYSLVVGPAGSPLELVLNSVYHVGMSPGLLPFSALRELEGKEWERFVRHCVPYAVGDSYRGYRVVATTDAVFSEHFPQPAGAGKEKFSAGGPFEFDAKKLDYALDLLRRKIPLPPDEAGRQAVLGAEVAQQLGLGVGDDIEPTHGIEGDHRHSARHRWRIKGVLKSTGTPIDRVVFITLDSFYRIPEHSGGRMPVTGEPALSAILVFPRGGYAKAVVLTNLRKRGDLQVADVPTEIGRLMSIVGNVDKLFFIMAILVLFVALIGITVAIYNSMNERRREIAILRALGAGRRAVFAAIVGEAVVLAAVGGLIGFIAARLLLLGADRILREAAGLSLQRPEFRFQELLVLLVVVAAGAVAGMIPAWKAYRTDVAANLAPLS